MRLGNSGLKVSKIILGCMSYGDKERQGWVLEEEEAISGTGEGDEIMEEVEQEDGYSA